MNQNQEAGPQEQYGNLELSSTLDVSLQKHFRKLSNTTCKNQHAKHCGRCLEGLVKVWEPRKVW